MHIKIKIKFLLKKFCFSVIIKLVEDNNLTKDEKQRGKVYMRKVKPLNDFIFKKVFGEKGNEDIGLMPIFWTQKVKLF